MAQSVASVIIAKAISDEDYKQSQSQDGQMNIVSTTDTLDNLHEFKKQESTRSFKENSMRSLFSSEYQNFEGQNVFGF